MDREHGCRQYIAALVMFIVLQIVSAHGDDMHIPQSPGAILTSCSNGIDGQRCTPAAAQTHVTKSASGHGAWDWLRRPAAGGDKGVGGEDAKGADSKGASLPLGNADSTSYVPPTSENNRAERPGAKSHLASHLRRVVEQAVLSISADADPDLETQTLGSKSDLALPKTVASNTGAHRQPTVAPARTYSAWDWLRDSTTPGLTTDTRAEPDNNPATTSADDARLASEAATSSQSATVVALAAEGAPPHPQQARPEEPAAAAPSQEAATGNGKRGGPPPPPLALEAGVEDDEAAGQPSSSAYPLEAVKPDRHDESPEAAAAADGPPSAGAEAAICASAEPGPGGHAGAGTTCTATGDDVGSPLAPQSLPPSVAASDNTPSSEGPAASFAAAEGVRPLAAAAAALLGVAVGAVLGATLTRWVGGRSPLRTSADAATQTDPEQPQHLAEHDLRPAQPSQPQEQQPQPPPLQQQPQPPPQGDGRQTEETLLPPQQQQQGQHRRQVPEHASSSQVSRHGPQLPTREGAVRKPSHRRTASSAVSGACAAAVAVGDVDVDATSSIGIPASEYVGTGPGSGAGDAAADRTADGGIGGGSSDRRHSLREARQRRHSSNGSSCNSCSGGGAGGAGGAGVGAGESVSSAGSSGGSSRRCSAAAAPLSPAAVAAAAAVAAQACGLTRGSADRRDAAGKDGGAASGSSGGARVALERGSEGCSNSSSCAVPAAAGTAAPSGAGGAASADDDVSVGASVATTTMEISPTALEQDSQGQQQQHQQHFPTQQQNHQQQQQQQRQYQLLLAQLQVQALAQLSALSLMQQQQQHLAHHLHVSQAGSQWGGGGGGAAEDRAASAGGGPGTSAGNGESATAMAPRWISDGAAAGIGGGFGGFGGALLPSLPGFAGPYGGGRLYQGALVAGGYPQPSPQHQLHQLQLQAAQPPLPETAVAPTAVGSDAIIVGGGAGGSGGGGAQLMVPPSASAASSDATNALVVAATRLMETVNMRMTEVAAVVSDASFAVRELSGDVREGAGLLRHVIGGWELDAQRGLVAAAMQRGMVVMWVSLVGASVRMGRWRAVAWTCSHDRPARPPEFSSFTSASTASTSSRSLGWWGLRMAGWSLGLSGRGAGGGAAAAGGSGGGGGGWASLGLGWAWERLAGAVGSRLLPAWLRVAVCYCQELGLYTVGLVAVFYLLRPLLRNTLSVDLRHSWAVDVPLLLGGVWGAVGCQVVASLGGRWTVWLAGWWGWCAVGGLMHARRLRGGGWAQLAALAGLTVAAPAAVALLPYMEWTQPAHEAMEGWWRAAVAGAAGWLGLGEEGGVAGALGGGGGGGIAAAAAAGYGGVP